MTKKLSLTPYLFLAPALLATAIFVAYPIAAVFYYSFTDYSVVTPPQWIGLANFRQLLGDANFRLALRNSFTYLLVTPILIVLSIVLAIIVNRKLRGISLFRGLYYVPVISGTIAIGICWRWLFNANGGLINGVLMSVGLMQQPVQWLTQAAYTLPIAMAMTIWTGMGYYMVVFLAGLQNISEELYEAASLDGCNGFQKHWHVSVPGVRPQMVFVAVISSLAALQVFTEIYVLTGSTGGVLNSGYTMVFYLWKQAFVLSHAGYASTIAIVLLVITLVFSFVNIRLLERGSELD